MAASEREGRSVVNIIASEAYNLSQSSQKLCPYDELRNVGFVAIFSTSVFKKKISGTWILNSYLKNKHFTKTHLVSFQFSRPMFSSLLGWLLQPPFSFAIHVCVL